MNYSQPEDFEPRETDRQTDEPTHDTKMWNSSMLWEVGLILLVALVLVFCAWNFGAQGREVAAIAHANRGMTWELSAVDEQ
jgi:heme/copper-type cytochrome/quinol oxidase subunit 2